MKYVIAILTMAVFITIYLVAFYINSKIEKPSNCKELSCQECNLNCNKRG